MMTTYENFDDIALEAEERRTAMSRIKEVLENAQKYREQHQSLKSIYKIKLEDVQHGGLQIVKMKCEKILKIGIQKDKIVLWYVHNDSLPEKTYRFTGIGTGWDCSKIIDYWDYIDTISQWGYVWHIFYKEVNE